jgi:hypothetical protein
VDDDDDKTAQALSSSSSSSFFLSFTTVTVSFVFLPLWKFALAKGWISWGYMMILQVFQSSD